MSWNRYNPLSALQQREQQATIYRQQKAKTVDAIGAALIIAQSQADETKVDITFTNTFTQPPVITFGSSLVSNQGATPGQFPTVNAVVLDWVTIESGPYVVYTGATIGVVTTGLATQAVYLHYRATGPAFSFPAGSQPTNTTGNA